MGTRTSFSLLTSGTTLSHSHPALGHSLLGSLLICLLDALMDLCRSALWKTFDPAAASAVVAGQLCLTLWLIRGVWALQVWDTP